MSMTTQAEKRYPSGPDEAYDLNTVPESFDKVAELLAEYGDICRIPPVNRTHDTYLINHPDYIRHVLLNNADKYYKGPGFERVKMLLGNGIIVSDGALWRRQRRMMQPSFNRKIIGKLADHIKRCNLDFLRQWEQKAREGTEINIARESSELALQIILRSILSDDLETIIEMAGHNPFTILTDHSERDMKLVLKFRELGKLILELIKKRRLEKPERFDFLSMFMEARDKETGSMMSDTELLDEVMTMIIAGHETSAISLTWVWYFIARYPHIESRVHQEVDQARYATIPDMDELDQLPYVKQVLEEALRYYPPVWLYSRKAMEDDYIGGYFVPSGTNIFISPYYIHRHPDFWPDADRFDPDRFAEDAVRTRHRQAFIPFSAGPRRCIGDFFATVEMQMHIGLMARKFRLEYIEDELVLDPAVNLRSKNPIYMKLISR